MSAPQSLGRPQPGNDQALTLAQQNEWIAQIKSIESPEVERPSDWLSVGLLLLVAGLALVWILPLWRGLNDRRVRASTWITADAPTVSADYV